MLLQYIYIIHMLWNHIDFLKLIIKCINVWVRTNVKKKRNGGSNKFGLQVCTGMRRARCVVLWPWNVYRETWQASRAFAFGQENWNPTHDTTLISLIWSCSKNIIIAWGWYGACADSAHLERWREARKPRPWRYKFGRSHTTPPQQRRGQLRAGSRQQSIRSITRIA